MKLIFVISSFNLSNDEYGDIWEKCISHRNRKKIQDKNQIKIPTDSGNNMYVFNGWDYCKDYDTNGVKRLAKEIKLIFNSCQKIESPIFILIHASDEKKNPLIKTLKNSGINVSRITSKNYHHDRPLNFYQEFIKPFGNCENNDSTLVEKIFKEMEGESSKIGAQTLRYNILKPLVAMDLLQQARNRYFPLDKKISKEIKKLEKEISEEINRTEYVKQIKKLCNIISCEYKKQKDGLPKELIYLLEKYDCTPSSVPVQDRLRTFAEELDLRITAL